MISLERRQNLQFLAQTSTDREMYTLLKILEGEERNEFKRMIFTRLYSMKKEVEV